MTLQWIKLDEQMPDDEERVVLWLQAFEYGKQRGVSSCEG